MGYTEDSKDPRISRLAEVAKPFTDGFMYEKKILKMKPLMLS